MGGAVCILVSPIGLDLAKSVFQVHEADAAGKVVIMRQLRCGQVIEFFKKLPPCVVGMEACATRIIGRASWRSLGLPSG